MKIARGTQSEEYWYVTMIKPTIYPACGEKSLRKSILDYPIPELLYSKKYHRKGCCTNFPRPRDWGYASCDDEFFKES